MLTQQTKIINASGLHARPASDFVAKAKSFKCALTVRNMDNAHAAVNAKSILRVLAEAMPKGTNVELTADGEDENEAMEALMTLINSGFGE